MYAVKAQRKTKVVPDYEQEPFENDQIVCPKCDKVQEARIYPDRKVFKHMHRCQKCKFIIYKKDWKSIR